MLYVLFYRSSCWTPFDGFYVRGVFQAFLPSSAHFSRPSVLRAGSTKVPVLLLKVSVPEHNPFWLVTCILQKRHTELLPIERSCNNEAAESQKRGQLELTGNRMTSGGWAENDVKTFPRRFHARTPLRGRVWAGRAWQHPFVHPLISSLRQWYKVTRLLHVGQSH